MVLGRLCSMYVIYNPHRITCIQHPLVLNMRLSMIIIIVVVLIKANKYTYKILSCNFQKCSLAETDTYVHHMMWFLVHLF